MVAVRRRVFCSPHLRGSGRGNQAQHLAQQRPQVRKHVPRVLLLRGGDACGGALVQQRRRSCSEAA